MKIKLFGLFLMGGIFLLFFAWIFINNVIIPGGGKPTPIPVPTNFNIDYSRLYLLTPGKSTLNDVIKIAGSPLSEQTVGDKIHLFYQTPSADYSNIVYLKNGVVVYVLENIFGNYRGFFENYRKKYGDPDFVAYRNGDEFPWYIFLNKGLGVQSSAGLVTALLHFYPQSEAGFFNNIGLDLGFSKNLPANVNNQEPKQPPIQ